MKSNRPIILLSIVLVAAVMTAYLVFEHIQSLPTSSSQADSGVQFGGPFEMVDDTGQTVTQADILGKPSVLFFGYTYCPDVCPTTLNDLSSMIDALGEDASRLNFVFISVDPERDTPEHLHQYLSYFSKNIRGFTGTPEQVAEITKAYGIYYKKVPDENGGYTVDHTASVFLFDAKGSFIATIDFQESREVALGKLRRLVALAKG